MNELEQSLFDHYGMRVGDERTFVDEYEIEKGMIKRFAQVIQDPNPLFYDEEYAKKTSYGGIIAPPTFLFEWYHHTAFPQEPDRPLGSKEQTPPHFGGRAGNEYELFEPLRPGDVIHCRSKVVSLVEKQGKSGRIAFPASETIYTNQNGVLLGIHREIMFYRL